MSSAERYEQRPRTETERAAYYYDAHRAEVEAWPEMPAPPETKAPKQRGVVLSVRFTIDEAAAIERAAQARGLTISAFLRTVAQEAAQVAPPPVNISHIADRLVALADELRPGVAKRRVHATTVGKQTSTKPAAAASKVLRDGRTSKSVKTGAKSTLTQRAKKKKKKTG